MAPRRGAFRGFPSHLANGVEERKLLALFRACFTLIFLARGKRSITVLELFSTFDSLASIHNVTASQLPKLWDLLNCMLNRTSLLTLGFRTLGHDETCAEQRTVRRHLLRPIAFTPRTRLEADHGSSSPLLCDIYREQLPLLDRYGLRRWIPITTTHSQSRLRLPIGCLTINFPSCSCSDPPSTDCFDTLFSRFKVLPPYTPRVRTSQSSVPSYYPSIDTVFPSTSTSYSHVLGQVSSFMDL